MSTPATQTPQGRPVCHDVPPSYDTGARLTREGKPHPDFGCVFWTDQSDYLGRKYRYDFDRDGFRFCMCGDGEVVTEGWLNIGGRSFRIAGPSHRQAAAQVVRAA